MSKVNAYKIVERGKWMIPDLEDMAYVISKNGVKKVVEDIEGKEWEVGDWVVLWPWGEKIIYKSDYFEKNFVHLGSVSYDIKF